MEMGTMAVPGIAMGAARLRMHQRPGRDMAFRAAHTASRKRALV